MNRKYKSNGDRFYTPWLIILIGVGVGFFAGFLFHLGVSNV